MTVSVSAFVSVEYNLQQAKKTGRTYTVHRRTPPPGAVMRQTRSHYTRTQYTNYGTISGFFAVRGYVYYKTARSQKTTGVKSRSSNVLITEPLETR